MSISSAIRSSIDRFPENFVFGASDFSFGPQQRQAVTKTLQRLVQTNAIKTLSKGRYYKPKRTIFGTLKPAPAQVAREFLIKSGKPIGYLTGSSVFSQYSLTTQISSKIQVGTNTYRQPVKRSGYTISFVLQANPISEENIEVLSILDCIRFIKKIPATTVDEACSRLIYLIKGLGKDKKILLIDNAFRYSQSTRALCGAILEYVGFDSVLLDKLKETISGASKSLYAIFPATLPTKLNWRIYEPTRK